MVVLKIHTARWLIRQLRPFWATIICGVGLAVLGGLLSTLDPLLMRRLIDQELPQHNMAAVMLLIVAIVGCLLGATLFLLWSLRANFEVQQDLGQKLRIAVLEQL